MSGQEDPDINKEQAQIMIPEEDEVSYLNSYKYSLEKRISTTVLNYAKSISWTGGNLRKSFTNLEDC